MQAISRFALIASETLALQSACRRRATETVALQSPRTDLAVCHDNSIDAHHDHRRQEPLPAGCGSFLRWKWFRALKLETLGALFFEKGTRLLIRNSLVPELIERI